MQPSRRSDSVSRWKVIVAFAAVYVIWGSTYLAIRFAVETIPPFLMAGVRFLLAGAMMTALARSRGAAWPNRRQWKATVIVGGLLLLGGNGGVSWAAQRVPSGISSLLVASVPLWMVLLDWLRPGGQRPSARVFGGVGLGLVGLAVLVGPGRLAGVQGVDLLGAGVLLAASFSWAIGSIYSRGADMPTSPLMATAMEMLSGGLLLTAVAVLSGDLAEVRPDTISLRSVLAVGYLVFFGAVIGFTAYIWLLRQATAAQVATYAYVNPVVAVFLGWLLANEPLTWRVLVAAAIIVAAVVIITTHRARPLPKNPLASEAAD